MDSIDGLSTNNDSDDESISMNALEEIWYGSQIHPEINARYARFKIRDRIRQTRINERSTTISE